MATPATGITAEEEANPGETVSLFTAAAPGELTFRSIVLIKKKTSYDSVG